MTQNERWTLNYHDILGFMTEQKKRPSKHRLEEHQMLNWIKKQKKRYVLGQMKPCRIKDFKHLLEVAEHYLRKNQYAYTYKDDSDEGFCGDLFDFLPNQKKKVRTDPTSKT